MKKSSIPFVGLHAHSVAGSPFDALGYPQDHMDYAYENGCEALALTDHGNMNGMAYQVLHAKKMKAEGKNFKPIFGVEAYFIPSLEAWNQERDKAKEDKKRASELKDSTTMSVENEAETKNPDEKYKHISSPYFWKSRPDKIVPTSLPPALAI